MRSRDIIIKSLIYICAIIVVFTVCYIIYFILFNGISEINMDFLLKNPEGMPPGKEGGVKNAIKGSLFLMMISIVFSSLLGVSCAVYRTVFCNSRIVYTFIGLVVQCIASIPSIIIGLFVYGFFIVTLDVPRSMLTAGISLGIMVFPFTERRIEKIISDIDNKIIRESYSLGIDKEYMCTKLILPIIKRDIISVAILAGSYAIGATAPILLTGAVFTGGSSDKLLQPVMALPFHLNMLLGQTSLYEKAYATAFVLICILVVLHILSEIIINGVGGKIVEYIGNKKHKYKIRK